MKGIFALLSVPIVLFSTFAAAINLTLPAEAQMPTMASCEQTCRSCKKVCQDTLKYCQKKGGKHADAKHINTLKDCINACQTSADALSRKSALHTKSCGFCAEICRACAASCDAFKDDKQMIACANECRKCAESCEKMSKMISDSLTMSP